MTSHYGLILDSLILVLLAATVVYAAILNRRLAALRDNRGELERATRHFSEAAIKADTSIKGLKRTADDTAAALQDRLSSAETLRDELAFLVEAGEAVAARLEGAASGQSRTSAGANGRAAAEAPSNGKAHGAAEAARMARDGRNGADADLLKAIETMR